MWPKLAGQHASYLVRQLQLMQSGKRNVPEMAALVSGLNEQDMADIAAYYASQSISPGKAETGKLQLGQSLYRAGNPETGTPACSSCHGPNGRGNPVSGYAVLAGQHAAYTDKSLKKFRATNAYGEDDAPSAVMSGVVRLLSDEEIAALSSYIQGLHVVD
jgi:cytochrome c553